MRCACGAETKVTTTRLAGDVRIRYRRCPRCGSTIATVEVDRNVLLQMFLVCEQLLRVGDELKTFEKNLKSIRFI